MRLLPFFQRETPRQKPGSGFGARALTLFGHQKSGYCVSFFVFSGGVDWSRGTKPLVLVEVNGKLPPNPPTSFKPAGAKAPAGGKLIVLQRETERTTGMYILGSDNDTPMFPS